MVGSQDKGYMKAPGLTASSASINGVETAENGLKGLVGDAGQPLVLGGQNDPMGDPPEQRIRGATEPSAPRYQNAGCDAQTGAERIARRHVSGDEWTAVGLEFAALTCVEGKYHRLIGGGSNDAEPGTCAAAEAVASGRPYFGVTHPWLWVIDIDRDVDSDPDAHVAYRELLYVLDMFGLEYLEVHSGQPGHRHVYVHESEGPKSVTRLSIVERLYLHPKVFDFRMQSDGCAIRPILSPHRFGGCRAEPVDSIDDAVAVLRGWFDEHRDNAEPRRGLQLSDRSRIDHSEAGDGVEHVPAQRDLQLLSERDTALLYCDWERADRIGPPTPRHEDGTPDLSQVEWTLARGFQYVGLPRAVFLQLRWSAGPSQSPGALKSHRGRDWLVRQWDAAAAFRPGSGTRGVPGLRDFTHAFVEENRAWLDCPSRRVLAALTEVAQRLGLVKFSQSVRQLEVSTLLSHGSVCGALKALRGAELIWVSRADEPWDADTINLQIQALKRLDPDHITDTPSVCISGQEFVLPAVSHVAWSQFGVGLQARDVLSCFSASEPRSQTEAKRYSALSKDTFRKYRERLVDAGVLVATTDRRPRYLVDPGFDWDEWAQCTGVDREVEAGCRQLRDRHDEERKDQDIYWASKAKLSTRELLERAADRTERAALQGRRRWPTPEAVAA